MALWRSRVRAPSGPWTAIYQLPSTRRYRGTPFVDEREGFFRVLAISMLEEIRFSTSRGTIFGMTAGQAGGPLLVGIHGWSQRNGWHTWQPLMEPLAQAGFRIVSVDMPGWGHSQAWTSGPLGEADAIEAILAVLDGAGAKSATLIGKSWGGGLAIAAALAYPERIDRLILTAPAFREPGKLAALNQPVLLAWAEDDPVIPYKIARLFVEATPHVELVTYPTGGHSAAPKNAEDFAGRAIAFLSVADQAQGSAGEIGAGE
jgi:pimeloyl-ACP methyl ester carboxylesterase